VSLREGRALRFGFLAVLAGGLVLFARARSPREMVVEVDLTGALPGDVVESDVIVSRGEHSLARVDERYGGGGAPATLRVLVRTLPGAANVEVTLVGSGGSARRTTAAVDLSPARPARLEAR
jgi:hypothetical protein